MKLLICRGLCVGTVFLFCGPAAADEAVDFVNSMASDCVGFPNVYSFYRGTTTPKISIGPDSVLVSEERNYGIYKLDSGTEMVEDRTTRARVSLEDLSPDVGSEDPYLKLECSRGACIDLVTTVTRVALSLPETPEVTHTSNASLTISACNSKRVRKALFDAIKASGGAAPKY